jgi:hypothetical protein
MKRKRIAFRNLRLSAGREGFEIYILPAFQLILNEYGIKYMPNWELRVRWLWFALIIYSKGSGKSYNSK